MIKRTLPFLLLVFSPLLTVQGQEECVFTLQRAERLFQAGQLDEIPALLRPCIASGFNRAERQDAYKLVVQTLLYNDRQTEAEEMMKEFLGKYPEYDLTPADPAEFEYLFKSYKTVPAFSLGVFVGGVTSFLYSLEQYGVHDYKDAESDYKQSVSFHSGVSFSRYLAPGFDLNLGIMYFNLICRRVITPFPFAETRFRENMSLVTMPLSVTWDLRQAKFLPYLRLGLMPGYFLSSAIDPKRSYTDGSNDQVSGDDLMTCQLGTRNRFNLNALVGAGMKYKISNAGYLLLDMRFHPGLTNPVTPENRLGPDSEMTWRYYAVDDDFIMNHLTFSVGWIYPIYSSRKQPNIPQLSPVQ